MIMTATVTAVYVVVPWSAVIVGQEYAVVDMEQYKETGGSEDAVLTFGSDNLELAIMADMINARINEAMNNAPAGTLALDKETLTMLEHVVVGIRQQLVDSIDTHPLINVLRKAVEDSGDEVAKQALAETEESIRAKKVNVTKEELVGDFIKRMYEDGVKSGKVKP